MISFLNQTRTCIVNYRNIQKIELKLNFVGNEAAGSSISCFTDNSEQIGLAAYATHERGKEVYEKLIQFLAVNNGETNRQLFVFDEN